MASIRLPFSILNPLLVIIIVWCSIAIAEGCFERERFALLDFKKSFASFPQNYGKLSSWNISSEECCSWEGIVCDESRVHVWGLDLSYQRLESHHLRPSLLKLHHLKSLYLDGNNLSMRIPEFIGSFRELSTLGLSNASFFGSIPPQLANLSSLEYLDLNGNDLSTDNFQWVSHLSSLVSLSIGLINLTQVREWLSVITKLPLLSNFDCYSCTFPAPDQNLNSSSSQLQSLFLFDSVLSSATISLFLNATPNLVTLDLDSTSFEGPSPNIFDQIGNLCNLETSNINSCSIKENISSLVQALGVSCASDSLQSLGLISNNLTGLIPPMLMFRSLTELYLDDNQLEGFSPHISSTYNTYPSHIFPPTLSYLSISNNYLSGVLLSEYFANVSQLYDLDLSNNLNLTISFSQSPSQIEYLNLRSCNLGLGFPTSILASLKRIVSLDLSNSNLSGSLPTIFWSNLPSNLHYLNLSYNNLVSVLPLQNLSFLNQTSLLPVIDLTSNSFYGPLPLLFLKATELHLSNNKFSRFAPLPYPYKYTTLLDDFGGDKIVNTLDISSNNLSGEIPDWAWIAISSFKSINLSYNNLSGIVPNSTTTDIYVLNLSNNRFFGQIPSFLKNSTSMRILDLSWNRFSGSIPSWIGEGLTSLVVLSMESNNFMGTLPRSLCHLKSLQILDLSHNKLSGTIPSCVNDFAAMTHFLNSTVEVFIPETDPIFDVPIFEAQFYKALIKWKGMDQLFHKSLEFLSLIDLSYNNLSGEIPGELMSLTELDSLDLSSNNFIGSIPNLIGQLKNLEYLNLSFNDISGPIPTGLADITPLGILDLSHNKLSGRIPKGTQLQTFDSSSFTANPGLCGEPLEVKCPGDVDDSTQPLQSPLMTTYGGDEWDEKKWFYFGSGAGFACGFLGIIVTFTWIRQWRYAFFKFANDIGEWMLLTVVLGASIISRKLLFK